MVNGHFCFSFSSSFSLSLSPPGNDNCSIWELLMFQALHNLTWFLQQFWGRRSYSLSHFIARKLTLREVNSFVWGPMASKQINQDSNPGLYDFRAHSFNLSTILPPKSSKSTLGKCLFKRASEMRRSSISIEFLNRTFTFFCCVTLGKPCNFSFSSYIKCK